MTWKQSKVCLNAPPLKKKNYKDDISVTPLLFSLPDRQLHKNHRPLISPFPRDHFSTRGDPQWFHCFKLLYSFHHQPKFIFQNCDSLTVVYIYYPVKREKHDIVFSPFCPYYRMQRKDLNLFWFCSKIRRDRLMVRASPYSPKALIFIPRILWLRQLLLAYSEMRFCWRNRSNHEGVFSSGSSLHSTHPPFCAYFHFAHYPSMHIFTKRILRRAYFMSYSALMN
jgi:hypothetical protein